MNADIVPITYNGGTGGTYLCHFIVSAKYNDYDKYKLHLSPHGNAHGSANDFPPIPPLPAGQWRTDAQKIEYVLEHLSPNNKTRPYYTPLHLVDTEIISNNFLKSIRIIYDSSDIDELVNVFLGKYIVDAKNITKNEIYIHEPNLRTNMVKYSKFYIYEKKYDTNMLFISWSELYSLDPDILVNKLHNFTYIPKENFSIGQLLEWRNATKQGAENVQKILNGHQTTQ